MVKRGQIYYIIDNYKTTGSEQYAGRPAIIVSNEICNERSPVVEVVFLTTQPKCEMPTHVTIHSATRTSIAICEQITSVAVERVGDFMGTCTEVEMADIDRALRVSLALENSPVTTLRKTLSVAKVNVNNAEVQELKQQLATAIAERDKYETMYNGLLDRLLDRR